MSRLLALCLYIKITAVFAVFSAATKRGEGTEKREWLSEGFSSLKIERTQTQIRPHTRTDTHTHTHARTYPAHRPPSQHIVYKWSSNGQVVIRHNKGATSANLLACSALLCALCISVCASVCVCLCVCVCVCVCVHKDLPHAFVHI